jgi:hypothetical protein
VNRVPRPPGLAPLAIVAIGIVAIVIAMLLISRPAGESVASPSPSVASPSASPSASASATAAAAPSTPAATRTGEFVDAQLNFAVVLPTGWHYSFFRSKIFSNDQPEVGLDVFTSIPVGREVTQSDDAARMWTARVLVSRNPQKLTPAQWAAQVEGGSGPVSETTVDGRPATSRENTDGLRRDGASPPLARHSYVADGVLMYDLSYLLGCCVPPPDFKQDDLLSIVKSFRFVAPASRPGAATISGAVRYPSEFLPAQAVYAIDVSDSKHFYRADTPQSGSQVWYRLADIAPGTYVIVAYLAQAPANPSIGGAYTRYVVCGMTSGCAQDHTLTRVTVKADDVLAGIDPGDWYAPAGTYPPRPSP